MRLSPFQIVIGILLAACLAIFAYLGITFRETTPKTAPVSSKKASTSTSETEQPRASITLGSYTPTIRRGFVWTADITTPMWATCTADVYDPEKNISSPTDPSTAAAKIMAAGKHRWTWNVPKDAQKGSWTVRFICGTYENLATADVAVKVE